MNGNATFPLSVPTFKIIVITVKITVFEIYF